MIYHIIKEDPKKINLDKPIFKKKIENQTNVWKNIDKLKIKKMLLTNYIDNINDNIDDELIKQKNRLILKSLILNLKYINDDNIIMNDKEIVDIIGINTNDNGLLSINNILYKNKKIPR